MNTAPDSATLSSLIEAFRQREQVGIAKYGVTVDRTDLTHVEWLQHALEEDMDRCLYMKRAIDAAIALIAERDELSGDLELMRVIAGKNAYERDKLREALAEIVRIHENVWSPKQADRIADLALKALQESVA